MALRAPAINCTLKRSPNVSPCGLLLSQAGRALEKLRAILGVGAIDLAKRLDPPPQ